MILGSQPSPGAASYLVRNLGVQPIPGSGPGVTATPLSYNAWTSQTSRFAHFRAVQPSFGANNIFRGPRIVPTLGLKPR